MLKSFPPNPCTPPPTDPTMWSFSSWWVASYVVLHLWMIPNVLSSFPIHWWGEGSWQSQGESTYVPCWFLCFTEWSVGGSIHYQAFQAHFLNLSQTSTHQHTNGQKPSSGPNLQNSEQPAHQFRWMGIPTEWRVRFGVKHYILYRHNIVRNLLCWWKWVHVKSISLPA